MPVLFPEVTDIVVTVGVTLGVSCPLPMTVKVGTEGVCIDGVTTGVKEIGKGTDDSEPGPAPVMPPDGSIFSVVTDGAETRLSVCVEG
jgi:hypothetical protein